MKPKLINDTLTKCILTNTYLQKNYLNHKEARILYFLDHKLHVGFRGGK